MPNNLVRYRDGTLAPLSDLGDFQPIAPFAPSVVTPVQPGDNAVLVSAIASAVPDAEQFEDMARAIVQSGGSEAEKEVVFDVKVQEGGFLFDHTTKRLRGYVTTTLRVRR